MAVIASDLGRSVAVPVTDTVGEEGAGKVDQVTREVIQAVLGRKVKQRRQFVLDRHCMERAS